MFSIFAIIQTVGSYKLCSYERRVCFILLRRAILQETLQDFRIDKTSSKLILKYFWEKHLPLDFWQGFWNYQTRWKPENYTFFNSWLKTLKTLRYFHGIIDDERKVHFLYVFRQQAKQKTTHNHSCFPGNFTKVIETSFPIEYLWRTTCLFFFSFCR